MRHQRLGINIDHVATIRNARGGPHPDPVRAAKLIKAAGGEGITAHLREDRRHIRDEDMARLKAECELPLNFEMAATSEMLKIALATKPHACCLVPEKREERTTESGLDVLKIAGSLADYIARLHDGGIKVSLFVDPNAQQLETAAKLKADIVELHTGTYCEHTGERQALELDRLIKAAKLCDELGLECHAGHGLGYETVTPVAAIPSIVELNIGHYLIGEAIFTGFDTAVGQMRQLMDEARKTD